MDIVDRLFELVDEKFKEQKDFAFALGVPAPRISEWRKRNSASFSKKEMLPKIAEVLGTTSEYLLTGEGPKKKTAPADVPDSDTISIAARDVASAYDAATPELQAAVRRVLGLM